MSVVGGFFACQPQQEPASRREALRGGVTDNSDRTVGLLFSAKHSCTATVVSPHVMVTAGHCVDYADSPADQFKAYFGTSLGAPQPGDLYYHVVSSAKDPRYVHPAGEQQSSADFDIGVVMVKEALTVTPVPLRRPPVGPEVVGRSARLLGYGLTVPTDTTDPVRRQVTLVATGVVSESLVFDSTISSACRGDSGGPVLFSDTDGEKLAAVISTGDAACAQWTAGAIIDEQALAFIDQQIATADPQPDMAVSSDAAVDPSMSGSQGCAYGGRGAGASPVIVVAALVLLALRRRGPA